MGARGVLSRALREKFGRRVWASSQSLNLGSVFFSRFRYSAARITAQRCFLRDGGSEASSRRFAIPIICDGPPGSKPKVVDGVSKPPQAPVCINDDHGLQDLYGFVWVGLNMVKLHAEMIFCGLFEPSRQFHRMAAPIKAPCRTAVVQHRACCDCSSIPFSWKQ